ncbi:MAG TPA: single-stranded DNA-binding protein [Draconibacterium sp.]|nr:single-stranded DNA-binding protein [Draconibacterium sp.]
MSVNKVILVGNVGKDPEIRHLDTGIAVANFPLATSETYTAKNGEKVTTTEWHNIVLWRGLAEVAEKYVTKGRQLYIEGRIRTRNYDDKDGNKRYITEIYGDTMQMLGTKADDNKSGTSQYNQNQHTAGITPPASVANEPEMDEPGGDEDLPF